VETGRDEIAEADRMYRDIIGGDEWPDDLPEELFNESEAAEGG